MPEIFSSSPPQSVRDAINAKPEWPWCVLLGVHPVLIFGQRRASMGEPAKDEFDAKCFLSKVGAGKTILEFHKNQHVFEQGDVSDTVFYIQKGKVKLTVLSKERAPNYGELPFLRQI
jgi:hypothetical protein